MKTPDQFSQKDLLELFDAGSISVEQLNHLVRTMRAEREQWLAQEPFAYCYTDVNGRAKELCESPDCQIPQDKRVITSLFKQAVPAQQVKIDRETIINVLLSIGGMSEGVIADAIIGAIGAEQHSSSLKDHQIAETINAVRDVAIEFAGTQQLRERIAAVLRPVLRAVQPSPAVAVPVINVNPDNDRDMLLYIMNAFETEHSVCSKCEHQEDTKDMDSAYFLREYLENYPPPSTRITEQDAFEFAIAFLRAFNKTSGLSASEFFTHWISVNEGRSIFNKLN